MSFDDYLTAAQAGKVLDITPERVRQIIKEGRLKVLRTPLGALIERQSLLDYLRDRSPRGKRRSV